MQKLLMANKQQRVDDTRISNSEPVKEESGDVFITSSNGGNGSEVKVDERYLSVVPVSSPGQLRVHRSLSMIKPTKPIKAWLSYYKKTAGSPATAFSSTWYVQPNQDSSWSSWQSVFDEFKVVEAELYWNTETTVSSSSAAAQGSNTIVVYDPIGTRTLTSVNAGMEYERFQLCPNNAGVPTYPGTPSFTGSTDCPGRMVYKVKIPSGVSQSTDGGDLTSCGQWRPTGDSANYYYGSFLGYTSVGGTSQVLQTSGFVRMLVEFRVRV